MKEKAIIHNTLGISDLGELQDSMSCSKVLYCKGIRGSLTIRLPWISNHAPTNIKAIKRNRNSKPSLKNISTEQGSIRYENNLRLNQNKPPKSPPTGARYYEYK